jgi:hypothetical protein
MPDDDPMGLKILANVHNETNDSTITLVIYYEFVVLMVV